MAPRSPDSSDADELTTNPLRPEEPKSGVQPSVNEIDFDDETQVESSAGANPPIQPNHPLSPDFPPIDTYGKYDILGRLAVGGMAEVFLARENATHGAGRHVAVKRILPQIADDDTFVQMFLDEARLAMRLNHPNICHIYDIGEIDHSYFIAMEWVNGVPLGKLIQKARDVGGLPIAVAVKVMAQVGDALNYAHQARDGVGRPLNIVHRDVSPQNVMIRFDGVVKLLDFGIAKAATQTNQTEAGIVKGKFSYMSPEQCLGKPLDARSDIFAIGACLYEALTGKPAFRRSSDLDTMRAIVHEPVPSARLVRADVPPRLDAILRKALAKDPAQRFQTAGEMYVALERFLAEQGEFIHAMHVAQFIEKVLPNAATDGPLTQSSPSGRRLISESGSRPRGEVRSDAATIDRHQSAEPSDLDIDTFTEGLPPVQVDIPEDDEVPTEQWSGEELPSIIKRVQAQALAEKHEVSPLVFDQETRALPDAAPFIPSTFDAPMAATSVVAEDDDGGPSVFLRVLLVLLALVAAAGITVGLMWTLNDEPAPSAPELAGPPGAVGETPSSTTPSSTTPASTTPANAGTVGTTEATRDTHGAGTAEGQGDTTTPTSDADDVGDLAEAAATEAAATEVAGEPAPATTEPTGRLIVTTVPPGANVRIGELEGTSPVTFDAVPTGEHAVHIALAGREDAERTVTIRDARTARLTLSLRPTRRHPRATGGGSASSTPTGSIAIDTSPSNTRVFLGARLLGRTPLRTRLPAGTVRLRFVTPDGRSTVRSVRVNANGESRAFLPLGGG